MEEAQRVIGSLLRRPSRMIGNRFVQTTEYPDFAWKEALVNAIAHRDYGIEGFGTEVWMFEDRLEVASAGSLPAGIALSDILTLRRRHLARNPRLVRAMMDLGLMRDQGEGIPRMFSEMSDEFLPKPVIEEEVGQVTVTLRNTSTLSGADREFVAGIGNAEVSKNEFRALLNAHRIGRVDNAAVRATTGLDTLGASRLLTGLRDRGASDSARTRSGELLHVAGGLAAAN